MILTLLTVKSCECTVELQDCETTIPQVVAPILDTIALESATPSVDASDVSLGAPGSCFAAH